MHVFSKKWDLKLFCACNWTAENEFITNRKVLLTFILNSIIRLCICFGSDHHNRFKYLEVRSSGVCSRRESYSFCPHKVATRECFSSTVVRYWVITASPEGFCTNGYQFRVMAHTNKMNKTHTLCLFCILRLCCGVIFLVCVHIVTILYQKAKEYLWCPGVQAGGCHVRQGVEGNPKDMGKVGCTAGGCHGEPIMNSLFSSFTRVSKPSCSCSPCQSSVWSGSQQNLTRDAFLKMPHNFRAIYSVAACVQEAYWKGEKAGKQNGNRRKMIWKSLLSTNVFVWYEYLYRGTTYLFVHYLPICLSLGINAHTQFFLTTFQFLEIGNELIT